MNLSRGFVLTLCTCSSLFFGGCDFDSPSKSAVGAFLDAYKNQDLQAMAQYSADLSLTETPFVLTGLPDALITQYKSVFTNFSYSIEREEALEDSVNVYVSITYSDCGSASKTAFNDYLNALNTATALEDPEGLLTDKLSHSLSANLSQKTETFIIPVKKQDAQHYQLTLTEPLKNALTANINAFASAIEAYNDSYNQ